MKKILFLFAIAAMFYGCKMTPPIQKDIRNSEKEKEGLVCDGYVTRIYRYGYDGHDYIMFVHCPQTEAATASVVHDPDCHCHADKNNTFNSLF